MCIAILNYIVTLGEAGNRLDRFQIKDQISETQD